VTSTIFTVTSPLVRTISLRHEAWVHIVEGHPEIAGLLEPVRQTAESPRIICESTSVPGSYLFVSGTTVTSRTGTPLTVVVAPEGEQGIIKTALFHRKATAGPVVWVASSASSQRP
jgi:hypothetical protein